MEETNRCPACGWAPASGRWDPDWTHCPNCLCGKHGEDDEGYECGGTLEPISIWVKPDGTWDLIQRCRLCGRLDSSPLHRDDNRLKVLSVAARPLAQPPFPIEKMEPLSALMSARSHTGEDQHEQRK